MGTIYLSCGHEAAEDDSPDGMGIPLVVADQAKDGSPAISYMHVCAKCAQWYEDNALIVEDEEAYWKEHGRSNDID